METQLVCVVRCVCVCVCVCVFVLVCVYVFNYCCVYFVIKHGTIASTVADISNEDILCNEESSSTSYYLLY